MFQYAFGLAYSLRHNLKLKFYAQELIERNEHNGLELDKVFNIHLDLATEQEVSSLPLVKEPSSGYHRTIAETKQFAYFTGWWNSEKYFDDYWLAIQKAFEWKNVYSSIPVAQALQESNRCAIHFRRGDYKAPKGSPQVFWCLNDVYYKVAIEHVIEKKGIRSFGVFSEDPEAAVEYFSKLRRKLPKDVDIQFLINDRKERSYLDMYLMSHCKGVIAANSSFSWWAAKLNVNKDIPVLMPYSWYINPAMKTKDIYPEGCVVL